MFNLLKKISLFSLFSIIFIFTVIYLGQFSYAAGKTIVIDSNSGGRIFEGVGTLSAGASTRLLIDYPEPYRGDILDYLFKALFRCVTASHKG